MPLALNVALLLMLSSLLLLTLALQSRLQAAVQRQRRHTEDQLMSAAQHWAGRVQRHCPEALVEALPSRSPCAGIEAGEGYRLVGYAAGGGSPQENPEQGSLDQQGSGDLLLELAGVEAPRNGARGAFALHWRRELLSAGEGEEQVLGPPQLVGIEERGLRASAAEAADAQGGEVPS